MRFFLRLIPAAAVAVLIMFWAVDRSDAQPPPGGEQYDWLYDRPYVNPLLELRREFGTSDPLRYYRRIQPEREFRATMFRQQAAINRYLHDRGEASTLASGRTTGMQTEDVEHLKRQIRLQADIMELRRRQEETTDPIRKQQLEKWIKTLESQLRPSL